MSALLRLDRLIAFASLCGILLSWPLWFGPRLYPLAPVFSLELLPGDLLSTLNFCLGILSVTCLTALLVLFKPRIITLIYVAVSILQYGLDQSRMQPWHFQYCLLLACINIFSSQEKDESKKLIWIALILGSTYFWSGVAKCNLSYFVITYPWMTQAFSSWFESVPIIDFLLRFSGPVLEVLFGLFLFLGYRPKLMALLLIGMHLYILTILGPFGLSHNSVVWPWNMTMIILLAKLYYSPVSAPYKFLVQKISLKKVIVFLLLVALPLSSKLFKTWDHYLSFSLYSGNLARGIILLEDSNTLPDSHPLKVFASKSKAGREGIVLFDWSYQELNVPLYPEKRVIMSIAKSTCEKYFKDIPAIFIYKPERAVNELKKKAEITNCADL